MQWCQHLEADYGMDPQVWQSLDGPSFRLSSKLCLCNSFHGCFVPNSKKGQSVHTGLRSSWVSCIYQIVSYILGILSLFLQRIRNSSTAGCNYITPGYIPQNAPQYHKDTCWTIFIIALFILGWNRKKTKFLSSEEWIKTMWHFYTVK